MRTRIILDVHGDPRVPTRLYGSPLRRLLAPVADALASVALSRADAIRTVSAFTTGIVRAAGREPDAEFPAYMDLEPFTSRPPATIPPRPGVLFVGVLERYKGVDVLQRAWPRVRARIADAELHVVGRGTMPAPVGPGITWTPELPTSGVAAALDAAWCLVLPSRSEGMGHVVVEAFCRGRAVVGTDDGGIPDLVRHGETGLLVDVDDDAALASALTAVLSDRELAERLGAAAKAASSAWIATPEAWARRIAALVDPSG